MKIMVEGTLGDAYTVGLKIKEDVEIIHNTIHECFYPAILEIYGLFTHIKRVSFNKKVLKDIPKIVGIPAEGMEWFPKLDLDYLAIADQPYIVISPHAGREDAMARKIPIDTVELMIKKAHPIPVILVGTDEQYKNIECYENLIGETNITELVSIISDSSGFCGPEGLSCFVALSHRVPSIIFWVRWQPVRKRLLSNPWQEYILDLIKI